MRLSQFFHKSGFYRGAWGCGMFFSRFKSLSTAA
jgi:hypothetical protein